jgi:anti-sigma regulatory factor (Ser/Thr protein kinase)
MLSWTVSHADSQSLRGIRHAFSQALRARGTRESDIEAGTIILGELLANACEHGQLPVHVSLHTKADRWRLTVSDSGRGITRAAQPDTQSLRGRGLYIIERLGARISIAPGSPSTVEVVLPFGS